MFDLSLSLSLMFLRWYDLEETLEYLGDIRVLVDLCLKVLF